MEGQKHIQLYVCSQFALVAGFWQSHTRLINPGTTAQIKARGRCRNRLGSRVYHWRAQGLPSFFASFRSVRTSCEQLRFVAGQLRDQNTSVVVLQNQAVTGDYHFSAFGESVPTHPTNSVCHPLKTAGVDVVTINRPSFLPFGG